VDKSKLNTFSGSGAGPVGVGTMSSRARPVTGVKLLDEPTSSFELGGRGGRGKMNNIQAELQLAAGPVRASFDCPWSLKRGMFYDVEARGENSQGCYLQVVKLPRSAADAAQAGRALAAAVTASETRFGANGGVDALRVGPSGLKDAPGGQYLETSFTFSTLSPSMRELPRKVVLRASWPPRGAAREVVALVLQGGVGRKWEEENGQYERMIMESFFVADEKSSLKNRRVKAQDMPLVDEGFPQ
jgi:hypothetical protein